MLTRIILALTITAVAVSPALAQTTSSTSTSATGSASSGAFNALSPGNQRIAQSLYEAQNAPSGSAAGSSSTLTLDQIAVMKQDGQGWGNVFRQMKADGRIGAKNLGEVVSGRYRPPATSSGSGSSGSTATSATTLGAHSGKSIYKSTGSDVTTGAGGTVSGTHGNSGKSGGSGHQARESGNNAGSGKAATVISTAKGPAASTSAGVTMAGPGGDSGHGGGTAGSAKVTHGGGHGKK